MTDDTLQRMAEYVGLGHQGDRQAARTGLEELWDESTDADRVTRCGIAHSLADLQDDPRSELQWDLEALILALDATEAEVDDLGMTQGTAGLMPSLHLNLADVYRRIGLMEVARGHALQARHSLGSVEANPYFGTVAEAIRRVVDRLDAADTH